ncbi:cysteine desulfurase family protein [Leadbettera azotonutricia]|uniref:Cysteine desulfurase n=1 Tax=Leadbettera azotonutricia (strain ATCC BAA-888 / DSM 13862 / ZAS-9) TaxID=545695 RepID=F5YCB0_LEAAZ|nr:aminotransferase class V-fold PLP-dependent enzyme [Leadbettera azotonutricia]AEF80741.1 cysteine desulfurase [Leadbettera azotonutricia ZAS-9]
MDKRRYFDWAATALPLPSLGDIDIKNTFGNPSSPYAEGRQAKEALEKARSRCAKALKVPAECLYFTSGGTESNALVLHSLLLRPKKVKFLYSAVEHPSVRENCLVLEKLGFSPAIIEVEKDGRVSPEILSKALAKNPDARLAAIMAVNNETGAIMDMEGLSKILRAKDGAPVHFHGDLVQAAGKIPLDIRSWDLDSASFTAHKLGGPRGIGLLYLRKPLEVLYSGGGQERGIRPGTENTSGALALAACLEQYASPDAVKLEQEKARQRWGHLIGGLKKNPRALLIPESRTEDDLRFSPWILQARFKDVPGEVMVRALDSEGFAVSTGSACSSSSPDRPVLEAMGLDEHARLEGIRISQGWSTTLEDIVALLEGIEKALAFL